MSNMKRSIERHREKFKCIILSWLALVGFGLQVVKLVFCQPRVKYRRVKNVE